MKYNEFVGVVTEEVRKKVGKDMRVELHTTQKNNGKEIVGLGIQVAGSNVMPAIYLEEYFKMYNAGMSMTCILDKLLTLYDKVKVNESWDIQKYSNYKSVKPHLVAKVINYKKNKSMLKNCPHRRYLDLAIVYCLLVEESKCGIATILVKNEHAQMWDVTESVLYEDAMTMVEQLLPARFQTMMSVMQEIIDTQLDSQEKEDAEDAMYVLSNKNRNFGATCILYTDELKKIADILGESYYILPSSVHEVIIMPVSKAPSKEELEHMVKDINETQVDEEEVLSNHAYFYDFTRETLLY